MRFSNISRFIDPKRSEEAQKLFLLDLAYITVLLPLLVILKAPMLLFLLLIVALLLARKKGTTPTLLIVTIVGIIAIFLSLYGAFNFSGLSRLKLFVELITYLLLLAVSLQRLTRKVNFYLFISPALLLALSLFFFDAIAMLVYVIFEIFILLWLILAYRMDGKFLASLRMGVVLFSLSLPWVILLFVFFPRISFEHASYGFRGDEIRRMGHDGLMHMDNNALLVPSDRIVMEVGFMKEVPDNRYLYFRGSVLYVDKKDHWAPLPRFVLRYYRPVQNVPDERFDRLEGIIAYKVSLYPTHKRWLYMLDLPFEAPTGALIDADFETTLKKAIDEPQHYDAGSALHYTYGLELSPAAMHYARDYNRSANPKTLEAAQRIEAATPDETERLGKIIRFFRQQDLTYTLRPDPLDLNNSTDSFLFEHKRGYCVHFAGSFVTMARMAGLPARVVTGFKGDKKNSVNTYLAVRERDAHAWAEVLVDERWERVETTATAAHVETETLQAAGNATAQNGEKSNTEQAHLYLLYIKYQVETWILQYSHFRQMQLLDKVKKHPEFAAKFAAAFLGLVLVSALLFFYFRRPHCPDRVLCMLRPVLKTLGKRGYVRREGETLHRLFARYIADHPGTALQEVDVRYHRLRYADRLEAQTAFRKYIQQFIREKESKP